MNIILFLNKMFSRLIHIQSSFATRKLKSAHQRINYYSKLPNFKLKTLIRPPDLTDPSIVFPIKIPIRYRHVYHKVKKEFYHDSSKISWDKLQPNEVLLALEKFKYLDFSELMAGLKILSETEGQEKHDWNTHEWVKGAMDKFLDNFYRIREKDTMICYHMMKKLKYDRNEFWDKIHIKILKNLYELRPADFEFVYLEYYGRFDEVFGENVSEKMRILMQGRIRQFSGTGVLKMFRIFEKEGRLDSFWLENVFFSFFATFRYYYSPEQVAEILRYMMINNLESHTRIFKHMYDRIEKFKFTKQSEIETFEEVLEEIQSMFESHQVEPLLRKLKEESKQLIKKEQNKKKSLHEIVAEDIRYFMEKRKLKEENENLAAA